MLFYFGLPPAWANSRIYMELAVMEELVVYATANAKSDVVARLDIGDVVEISQKKFGRFRKVVMTVGGQKITGFVLSRKMARSQIRQRVEEIKRPNYNSKAGVGLAVVPAWMNQEKSSFQLSDNSIYTTSAFTSSTLFFAAFMDVPLSERWAIRPYATYRNTDFRGTARSQSGGGGMPSNKVSRKQTLFGLGAVVKHYQSEGAWWWGGGVELAAGRDLKLNINGVDVPTSEKDKPFFLMTFVAVGAEIGFPYFNKIYLVPDLRLGAIATTSPYTLYGESFLAVACHW